MRYCKYRMVNYKILAWSASKVKNDYNPSPIIYINPDDNFKKYAINNKDIIHLSINGTNSLYDNRKYIGIVSTSENVPCFRPNYYDLTGQFVITLDSNWIGFPSKKGYITIDEIIQFTENDDLKGILNIKNNVPNYKKVIEKYNSDSNSNSKSNDRLFIITIILLCVLIGLPLLILIILMMLK